MAVIPMACFEKNLLDAYPDLRGMERFPITDNHMHLDPGGLMEKAVMDFFRTGGTHVVLVHKPYHSAPVINENDFNRSFDITLDLADRIRKRTPVQVTVAVGPYPVNLLYLEKKHGLERGREIMMKGMETAASMVEEGLVQAIGEIGRPHFPVSEDIMNASNEILKYGLTLARENDCPVHLHTEGGGAELYAELASLAKDSRCPRDKVIKHFSGPSVLPEENHGLFPSVLASRKNIEKALKKGVRFMMETDYIDDPKRPGAVMVPKSIPRRTFQMIGKGLLCEEDAFKIHKDWPERIYGIEVEL